MDKLKVGGTFESRSYFTDTFARWSVGSFGFAKKFVQTKTTGASVEYSCKTCQTVGSPANVRIAIKREKSGGRITSKGGLVTVKVWNLCECEIGVAETVVTIPFVGQTFPTREDFTTYMGRYCHTNRKNKFVISGDSGNRCTRVCRNTECQGRVVVSLKELKFQNYHRERTWVPPLTVEEVVVCSCHETGGHIVQICLLCFDMKPES